VPGVAEESAGKEDIAEAGDANEDTTEAGTETIEAIRTLIEDGRYAEAEQAARELLKDVEARDGSDSLQTARVLDVLVEALTRSGGAGDPESRKLGERAVEIKERLLDDDHEEVARSLFLLGRLLRVAGKLEDARDALERSVAIQKDKLGPDHPDLAASLNSLGVVLQIQGDYEGARPLHEEALRIARESMEPEHFRLASYLNSYAMLLKLTGDLSGARPVFEEALEISKKILGPEHPQVAGALGNLANLVSDLGELGEARALLEEALAIKEKAFGPDHPEVASAINDLAITLWQGGDIAGARPLLERALKIREQALGPEHRFVADSLLNVGIVLSDQGELTQALPYMERALSMREKLFGPEHPAVADALDTLAVLHDEMGDLPGARSMQERALEIREKALGPEHLSVAFGLNNLGILLMKLGDLELARSYMERAVVIKDRTLGPENSSVIRELNNLAMIHNALGDIEGARNAYTRVITLSEQKLGPDHPDLGTILNNFGMMLLGAGEYAEAKGIFERSLEIKRKALGSAHYSVAIVLNNLGDTLDGLGNHATARSLHLRALSILQRSLGPDHLEVANVHNSLALSYYLAGETTKALGHSLRAEKTARAHFRQIARSASEREAIMYEPVRFSALGTAFSILLGDEPRDPAATTEASRTRSIRQVWDALIRSRAMVLDEMASLHRAVAQSDVPEIAGMLSTRNEARERLARLVVQLPEPETSGAHQEELREAQMNVDRVERELARRSAPFREHQRRLGIGFREVLSALPREAALVSFMQYDSLRLPSEESDEQLDESDEGLDEGGEQSEEAEEQLGEGEAPANDRDDRAGPFVQQLSYVALVTQSDDKIPLVVPLGGAEEIDALIGRYRELSSSAARGLPAAQDRSEEEYREAAARLRETIWDPLLPHLDDAGMVFIVPDGAINLVSFAALPSGEDGYLVETGPILHYLSSERDLMRAPRGGNGSAGLLALGGPDYDLEPGVPGGAAVYRGSRAACGSFQELQFAALPASKLEAEEIASLWEAGREEGVDAPPKITLLTGAEASEGALKEMAADHAVIHLATHGFFLQKDCRSTLDEARREAYPAPPLVDPRPAAVYDNPLLLSGLALAGANRREEADPEGGAEDGILTAEEIATIDLSRVDWAVLSACETGVGEVRAGEGVLGLRRAFETAGAATLIMSLWAVEDAAAREWMKRLYEARLSGVDGAKALKRASLEVLRTRREAGRSTHPFYWGAFVAAGDWR
jgi:tetratricopeptide (TPR) repeat protein/CHAT domain-containing protein